MERGKRVVVVVLGQRKRQRRAGCFVGRHGHVGTAFTDCLEEKQSKGQTLQPRADASLGVADFGKRRVRERKRDKDCPPITHHNKSSHADWRPHLPAQHERAPIPRKLISLVPTLLKRGGQTQRAPPCFGRKRLLRMHRLKDEGIPKRTPQMSCIINESRSCTTCQIQVPSPCAGKKTAGRC